MPESASTQILSTKIEDDARGGTRVDLVIGDAATLEEATESVAISVCVSADQPLPRLAYLQLLALSKAANLIRENSRPLEQAMDDARHQRF